MNAYGHVPSWQTDTHDMPIGLSKTDEVIECCTSRGTTLI